jgi:hypothetical protein
VRLLPYLPICFLLFFLSLAALLARLFIFFFFLFRRILIDGRERMKLEEWERAGDYIGKRVTGSDGGWGRADGGVLIRTLKF